MAKRKGLSAAQRAAVRKRVQSAKYSAKRAAKDLKDLGLYNPLERKMTRGRRGYINKLVRKKFADLIDNLRSGAALFVPAKKKKPAQRRTIAKQAKEVGFTPTRTGVIVPGKSADGTQWENAAIKFNKRTGRYFVERTRQPKKKGAPPQKSRIAFANVDRVLADQEKLRKEFNAAKRGKRGLRFIVYGRGLSRNIYTDFDDMIQDLENHYYGFRDDRSEFITHIEFIEVDRRESRNSIYRRLFRRPDGSFGIGGTYIGKD